MGLDDQRVGSMRPIIAQGTRDGAVLVTHHPIERVGRLQQVLQKSRWYG